ncbi:hypothetical protein L598_003600000240 [Mesorhizobium sp. J18]|uniref:transglycosylase SLT domain-containing protein n=1 Tax=Mesorhizobium sp. J18 TaxID=935263 RepID=UPI00119B2565|nr:transglycosylase SLT domain-containing protein [Mesorhizobium sp. J18]TWG94620.1 hypothetical protein L598_003600000240 [Mesorhizobium sp. J18]
MFASGFNRVLAIALLLALSACATPPKQINDVCAVFDQRAGFFNNWHSAARRAEQRYGIPVPVLMATIRKESGFNGRARPPRTKLLGFIPWKHKSTAYGYSQALNGTWEQYQRETGRFAARRSNFADAVDFVGWYHSKTAERYGVARNDAYNLYLAYYFGWGGYGRGDWRNDSRMQRYARETEQMAQQYAVQLGKCGI